MAKKTRPEPDGCRADGLSGAARQVHRAVLAAFARTGQPPGRGGVPAERAGRQVPLGHQPVQPGGEQPGRQHRIGPLRPFPGAEAGRDQLLQLPVGTRV